MLTKASWWGKFSIKVTGGLFDYYGIKPIEKKLKESTSK